MRIETAGALILCAALVGLALFVISHNRHAPVNRRFALSAVAIAGWIISISTALSAGDLRHTVLLGRLGFAFASTIPFTLLWMFSSFSTTHNPRNRPYYPVFIPGIFCVVFVFLSFSPWIVAGAATGSHKANFLYGPLHRFFGLYFLLSFIHALYTLWNTTRSASGLRKLQLRYLLLGILLGGAGAITTNLLIPLFARTSSYSALGPYFSLLVVSFSAHAIIRYRLMDIRVVIRTGVVYACAIVAAASVFILFADLLRRLTGYERNSIPLAEALLVALLLAILFQPLKALMQRSLNRYLYRNTYDYQRIIRDASRRLSTILAFEPLLAYLANVVEHTFKAEAVAVYLRDPNALSFVSTLPLQKEEWHREPWPNFLPSTSPLVALLEIQQRPLVREEAGRYVSDALLASAGHTLQVLGADIALPFIEDHALVGFVLIGQKRSGDPYFAEDIDLLETLIGQASIAMKNARLYHQVVLVNEYVDNILSTMDSGVIAVDAAGNISLFNQAAEHLTGLSSSAIHGRSLDCLPNALAHPLRLTLETNASRSQLELLIPGHDGMGVPLVCSTATLKATDGSPHGALIVFSNLTRIKSLEREKRRSERLASLGALASGVAHEIKNPLVAIRTFAELLPERYTDEDFREDFSKVVIREIARIDDLVGRLRGIAATAPQRTGKVDIRNAIKDTLSLLRAQFEQTHTVVTCEFRDPAPFVAVDEAQLKQLFLNLFLNSLEAMVSGGAIRIEVSRKESQDSSWVVTHVADTGPGIPDSVKANIFDPFFTTKPKGSGLGLAICRGIADAHRGSIRAEPCPAGTGTLITVDFPAYDDAINLIEQDASHH